MIPYHLQESIEKSLEEIGIDPYKTRGKKDGQWDFRHKNSDIYLDILPKAGKTDEFTFQALSPLCKMVDTKIEEFAIDLLEINYLLYDCTICKVKDRIYVLHVCDADDLSKQDIDKIIDRVAFYSADYWSKLSFKYKGAWDESKPNN